MCAYWIYGHVTTQDYVIYHCKFTYVDLPYVKSFQRRLGSKSSRLLILPLFWPNAPNGYFGACRTLLKASRIKDKALRYNALLNALLKSPDTLKKVPNMLPAMNVKAPDTELECKLTER